MARRRRKKNSHEQDEENLERWLVSYADFVTLLFAFFVVMYSISSVNEGKYRVLSETLNAVFEETERSLDPIQVGEIARSPVSSGDSIPTADEVVEDALEVPVEPPIETTEKPTISEKLEQVLLENIDGDEIEIVTEGDRTELRMNSKMLFASGNAKLSDKALVVLKKVASVVQTTDLGIQIEGHTDNIPIKTAMFPSNWELSAARAASVVHFLASSDIDASRLAAVGYGENRPIASNRTAEGRQKNRRVTMVLLPPISKEKQDDFQIYNSEEDIPWAEGPAVQQ